jgi:transposase
MRKEAKLIHKVKRLIRKAGMPRWLHRFGPKKYQFWQHLLALLVKQECKLSYRRTHRQLTSLGYDIPTYSALAKSALRVPLWLWQKLLQLTAQAKVQIAALDATGMSRSLPSPYFYKRIDKPYPTEIPLKLSLAVDTRRKKILALRVRANARSHDIKDAKYLIKRISKPEKVVADSAYDAEHFYDFLWERGIMPVVKVRRNAYHGFVRKKVLKSFRKRTYNRRSIVESVFFAIKRKFGFSVSSLRISAQRAEMYCRAIAHNICCFIGDFQLGWKRG